MAGRGQLATADCAFFLDHQLVIPSKRLNRANLKSATNVVSANQTLRLYVPEPHQHLQEEPPLICRASQFSSESLGSDGKLGLGFCFDLSLAVLCGDPHYLNDAP